MAKSTQTRGGGAQSRKERTREKIAAQREAQRRAEARRRLLISVSIVVVVIAVIGALVAVGLSKKKTTSAASSSRQPAPTALVAKVEHVPVSVLNQVGAGSTIAAPVKVKTATSELRVGGKPEIVYVGAEYCPHCGAERWAMVNALSRFGTFTGLDITHSAAGDGDVPTFSFYTAKYHSAYLALSTTEQYTNQLGDGFYTPLQPLTALDTRLLKTYDAPPYIPSADAGSIPFIDYANRYIEDGGDFNDSIMADAGLTWNNVAADMANPASPVGQGLDGSANLITATVCRLTGGQPGNVCTAPGVVAAAAKLPS
jgi:hypothetical protein